MASKTSRLVLIAVLVVVGLIGSGRLSPVQAQSQTCGLNYWALYNSCWTYVESGTPQKEPSAECCKVLKGVDIPCACKVVANVAGVSPQKAVYVAKECGVYVQPGTKCGGYTVPRA